MRKINVGIIGFGTIGAGVVKVLQEKKDFLKGKSGVEINLAAVCDRDIKTKRPVKIDKKLLTKSVGKILYDPKIDIIVELVGGIKPAKDIVLEALRSGKHVVTANKSLISAAGDEIFSLANSIGLSVGFEASVGGGIPIIESIKEGFVANKFDLIYGIINGTSNFILTEMGKNSLSFKAALSIAQSKGYAERDPYLDVSGSDSSHKLSILALLGFGVSPSGSGIYTEGITDIEELDMAYADELGYVIKLLAIAKRSGGKVELRVHPTMIPKTHLLASVNGAYNAIFVKGDLVGENLFYGQGAGAKPTSSAVVSDIVRIAKNISCCGKEKSAIIFKKDVSGVKKMDDVMTRYYIRFSTVDKPGVLARISGILAKNMISIANVTQKDSGSGIVPIVMMTHEALEKNMAIALKEIDGLAMIKRKSVRIRVER